MKTYIAYSLNRFSSMGAFNTTAVLIIVIMSCASCFKEESPIPTTAAHTMTTVQIPLTSQYDKHIYFDLFTNQIVAGVANTSWDLAFDAGKDEYHIWLNSSKMMQVYNTRSSDFSGITDESGAKWTWDYPEGTPAHNAIGEWGVYNNGNVTSFRHVYLIDRGESNDKMKFGLRKVVFEGLQNNIYRIRFAKLSGEDMHVVEIPKDPRFNRVYFSFDQGGKIIQVEPPKESWDLVFTRYTHIFFEHDTMPYLVTGTLLNPAGVLAARDSSVHFYDITINDVNKYQLSSQANIIGYNWKSFDINDTRYSIVPNIFYIVKDLEGNYYKLRFIDFFNETGERGYPTFEYQML